jgi:hypothetical protein
MGDDLFALLERYFESDEEGGNPAQDLLIVGFSSYMNKLKTRILTNFLLHPDVIFASPEQREAQYDQREQLALQVRPLPDESESECPAWH